MKKALIVLALSLLLLEGILAYDAIFNDGEAFSGLLGGDEYTDVVSIEPYDYTYVAPTAAIPTPTPTAEVEAEVVELGDEKELEELNEETAGPTGEPLVAVDSSYEYYYGFLSDSEKKVYRQMTEAFSSMQSGNVIDTLSDDSMNKVVNAIRYDHPELFYLDEIGYVHYTLGGQIQKTTLSVTYTDSAAAIRSKQGLIDNKVNSIISQLNSGASDYEKVKYVYETVINMTEYDLNASDNQNIISVFVNGRSVCAGYAKAVQYLLNKMGVDTTLTYGVDLMTGSAHAWNLVKIDGQYYYLDATWGDTSYVNPGGNTFNGGINYGYLNITTDELTRTHAISSEIVMPNCVATDANYYVKEGLYLYSYDADQLRSIFDRAYSEGADSVNFKCASLEVYDSIRHDLVDNSRIFDYLRDSKTVSYSADEDQRTLCFWL